MAKPSPGIMPRASEIIDEIKERERKGFLKKWRQREKSKEPVSLKTYLQQLPFHIQNALKIAGEYKYLEKVDRVIFCGVGINGVAGRILKDYLGNIELVTGSSLPKDVDSKTLVFIASYSGREEEPMLCYRNALRKGCKTVGITSGGNLLESFRRNNVEHIVIPSNLPECISLPYTFFTSLRYLENSNIVKSKNNAINETVSALKRPDYPEMARKLAENSKDKIPLIYSSVSLNGVALHWKQQINRISKTHCFYGTVEELSYVELDAFLKGKEKFHVILMRDVDDNKQEVKAINVAKGIIKNKGYSVTELLIRGKYKLSKFFSAIFIGEVTAYYLSEIYKTKDEKSLVNKFRDEYANTV